jgi:hypothetical protein
MLVLPAANATADVMVSRKARWKRKDHVSSMQRLNPCNLSGVKFDACKVVSDLKRYILVTLTLFAHLNRSLRGSSE